MDDAQCKGTFKIDFPEATPLESLFKCKCDRGNVTNHIVYSHRILNEDSEEETFFEIDRLVCPECAAELYQSFHRMKWGLFKDGMQIVE